MAIRGRKRLKMFIRYGARETRRRSVINEIEGGKNGLSPERRGIEEVKRSARAVSKI